MLVCRVCDVWGRLTFLNREGSYCLCRNDHRERTTAGGVESVDGLLSLGGHILGGASTAASQYVAATCPRS